MKDETSQDKIGQGKPRKRQNKT